MKYKFIPLLLCVILNSVTTFGQGLKPTELMALVNVRVTNLAEAPIKNELVLFVSANDSKEYMTTTDDYGQSQILLPKGHRFDVKYKDLIEKVDHSSFEIPGGLGKYSFDIIIKFEPSDMIVLKGLTFDNNDDLDDGLNIELEMMLEVLQLNKKMEIQIAAHSDNSNGIEKSLLKTKKQADSVKAFFVNNGIDSKRIVSEGIGMAEPLGLNALPAGREINNRIEIRVIKKYL